MFMSGCRYAVPIPVFHSCNLTDGKMTESHPGLLFLHLLVLTARRELSPGVQGCQPQISVPCSGHVVCVEIVISSAEKDFFSNRMWPTGTFKRPSRSNSEAAMPNRKHLAKKKQYKSHASDCVSQWQRFGIEWGIIKPTVINSSGLCHAYVTDATLGLLLTVKLLLLMPNEYELLLTARLLILSLEELWRKSEAKKGQISP